MNRRQLKSAAYGVIAVLSGTLLGYAQETKAEAQQNAGSVGSSGSSAAAPAQLMEKGGGCVSERITARKQAEDLCKAKGWEPGPNKKDTGEEFIVTIAAGDIQAPLTDNNYLGSRVNAFDKAMLDAWAQTRKFVGQSVEAKASSMYREATGGVAAADPESETAAKLNSFVSGAVKKAGLDPSTATVEQKEKAVNREEFSKAARSYASGSVMGVQCFASFEGPGTGKGYSIVVVTVWSDKLQRMAECMLRGGLLPLGAHGKAIKDWIPTDTEQLISTFGVQMVTNEKGQPVLLAYGQSRPLTDSDRSVEAAYDKAELDAVSQLRFFAGMQASVMSDMRNAESSEEFADKTRNYTSSESFSKQIDVFAPAALFKGVSRLKPWSVNHPLTKKTMAGVVVSWSPQSALVAGRMGAKMDAQPKQDASSEARSTVNTTGTTSPTRQSIDASDKGRTGQGATGGDDF